ncbi:MAG: 2-oxo acid dehydrogenase subunit E2, partial [Gammaproteobacteria bacterium]|nr:2-oxo acid dehydrogenase subunit E2 [Gammaproteobacteria bacterium]
MSRYVFRMPDLGEGTVEAELVEWKVAIGDPVSEEQIIAEVMTDKAAVEVPSPVTGRVVALTGAPGDMIPVGAELIVFETEPEAAATGAIAATAGAMAGAALDTDAAARPAAGAA